MEKLNLSKFEKKRVCELKAIHGGQDGMVRNIIKFEPTRTVSYSYDGGNCVNVQTCTNSDVVV